MKYDLEKSIEVLSRTPGTLERLLSGLSDDWIHHNEGPATWSAYDIVGHLIHGERTDWIPRMKIILSDGPNKNFVPFDRFAQLQNEEKPLAELLQEFRRLREVNITELKSAGISEKLLSRSGIHPEFGKVTLSQLLATWVAHDLNHIGQIARVMAKQYKEAVGPWVPYIGILSQ